MLLYYECPTELDTIYISQGPIRTYITKIIQEFMGNV